MTAALSMREVGARFSALLILINSPRTSSEQYFDHSFGDLGTNARSKFDYEEMDHYDEKDKVPYLETLFGDFSETDDLLKGKIDAEEHLRGSEHEMTLDEAAKAFLPGLNQVQ